MIRTSATPEAVREVLDELRGIRHGITRAIHVRSSLASGGKHPFQIPETNKLARFANHLNLVMAACREWLEDHEVGP